MNHNSLQCHVHGPFYEGRSARPVIRRVPFFIFDKFINSNVEITAKLTDKRGINV